MMPVGTGLSPELIALALKIRAERERREAEPYGPVSVRVGGSSYQIYGPIKCYDSRSCGDRKNQFLSASEVNQIAAASIAGDAAVRRMKRRRFGSWTLLSSGIVLGAIGGRDLYIGDTYSDDAILVKGAVEATASAVLLMGVGIWALDFPAPRNREVLSAANQNLRGMTQ